MPIPLGFYVIMLSPSLHWCAEQPGCLAAVLSTCLYYVVWAMYMSLTQSDWVLLVMVGCTTVCSHVIMNCCLPWYCPNLWVCQHCCAACTDASCSCFDSRGSWRTVSFSMQIKCRASHGSCWAPLAYTHCICSLTAEWSICCCSRLPEWSSLLWWSHISQDMSQSFWMSADVHLLLDLWDRTWLQILSCWLLQYCDSHPSSNLSQPIWVCSSSHRVECVLDLVWVLLDHALRLVSSVSLTAGSVPCAHSHCFNLFKLMVHCCLAPWAGHCMMCCLSAVSALHQGHCADDLCPLLSMFFPCANPVICFDIHLLLYAGASCITLSIAYRSSLVRPWDRFGIFHSSMLEQVVHWAPFWHLVLDSWLFFSCFFQMPRCIW